ncbi:hypothetical protein F5J12DRAFT_808636 [Pisolithus orientalis]|uniref:uncharacterized protein n=1 Tax=Pisolithus orientalis TaxID=936130 RepID=UPI0022246EE0|nr:uncharacterized protein F5J12DRAFT_808636 [Pisolithus orientalis]KAI6028898.1 hypothetical protein F5J12DRAFT_808636 [Pisolithus orientalis]
MITKERVNVSGTIALKSQDGRYMKVFNEDGLRFHDDTLDDDAKFTVTKLKNGNISLKGPNGKIVNMYYVSDVKCAGPHGGVEFGVIQSGGNWIKLTISGYQGMGSRCKFLSSIPGHKAYHGSLAVKENEDYSCYFSVEKLD